jgi:hypothetical protein
MSRAGTRSAGVRRSGGPAWCHGRRGSPRAGGRAARCLRARSFHLPGGIPGGSLRPEQQPVNLADAPGRFPSPLIGEIPEQMGGGSARSCCPATRVTRSRTQGSSMNSAGCRSSADKTVLTDTLNPPVIPIRRFPDLRRRCRFHRGLLPAVRGRRDVRAAGKSPPPDPPGAGPGVRRARSSGVPTRRRLLHRDREVGRRICPS